MAIILGFAAGPSNAAGVAFDKWLNGVIQEAAESSADKAVKVSVENTAESKKVVAPSGSNNSSSLVDTSSVSDLVGIGLNLAGLSGSSKGGGDVTSASATVSGYAFYSAIKGIQPLDPTEYCQGNARLARAFSATMGYDDGQDAMDPGKIGSVILAGAKLSLWPGIIPGEDACTKDTTELTKALVGATQAAARLSAAAQDKLAELTGMSATDRKDPVKMVVFINTLGDQATVDSLMETHGAKFKKWLASEYFNEETVKPFRNLNAADKKLIADMQGGHRLAINFLTKQRDGSGTDEYQVSVVWDWGIAERLSFTGNGEFNYESVSSAANSVGGTLATALQFTPVLSDEVWGTAPVKIDLGFSGNWMSNQQDTYKGQLGARVSLPWGPLKGIEIPLTLTVANRTELIDETDVRGMVGFSIDTSQLFGALDPVALLMGGGSRQP